jgi:hypothetical protein
MVEGLTCWLADSALSSLSCLHKVLHKSQGRLQRLLSTVRMADAELSVLSFRLLPSAKCVQPQLPRDDVRVSKLPWWPFQASQAAVPSRLDKEKPSEPLRSFDLTSTWPISKFLSILKKGVKGLKRVSLYSGSSDTTEGRGKFPNILILPQDEVSQFQFREQDSFLITMNNTLVQCIW